MDHYLFALAGCESFSSMTSLKLPFVRIKVELSQRRVGGIIYGEAHGLAMFHYRQKRSD